MNENEPNASDLNICSICLENEKNTVIVSCGHLSMCERCAKKINKCPICRKSYEVKDLMKIYNS
jgi:hypothetical protein